MIEGFPGLIDRKNEAIWKEISARYNIKVASVSSDEHSVFSKGDDINFFVPHGASNPDTFTHEILHVYLRSKGILIGANLTKTIAGSQVMSRLLTPGLVEQVGNILDHIKMYPIYEQMGCDPEKFILDYHKYKCEPNEMKLIQQHFKVKGSYNSIAVDAFIGRYFSIKGDFNKNFDYSDCLKKLEKIDGKLFEVLELFHDEWVDFDINEDDPDYTYKHVVSNFYDDMKEWITGKEFL
ncbi:MAG: hypothetical protein V4557_12665 [Bacteroidota bacterium]